MSERVRDANVVLERNVFDHVTGSLLAKGEAEPAERAVGDLGDAPRCQGVEVSVIAASEDADWSMVAIAAGEGSSKKGLLRRRGGKVADFTVAFVGPDRVWLEGPRGVCQAVLGDREARSVSASPEANERSPANDGGAAREGAAKPGISAESLAKHIVRMSATEFEIDRSVIDQILEHQAELLRGVRISPQAGNEGTTLRLTGLRPGSLLAQLGLANGDQIRTLNGYDLSNPEKGLEAFARLRQADKLTLQLARGGRAMTLDYSIR